MKKINLFLAIIILLLTSCEKLHEDELNKDPYKGLTGWRKYDKMIDHLFESGFTMSLKEVYPVYTRLDGYTARKLVDDKSKNIFANKQSIINARNLTLEKGGLWKISKLNIDTIRYELAQDKYQPGRYTYQINKFNCIKIEHSTNAQELIVNFNNGVYTEYSWDTLHGIMVDLTSNLKLSVFDFDGEYLKIITNYQVLIGRQLSTPLTSNQVKVEISRGNYEIVMVKNNITAYKIGENFYVPSYGNSYVYYGSTSANTLPQKISSSAFILVFKIKNNT